MGLALLIVYRLAGGRLATPRQLVLNVLVIIVFWLFYVVSQAVGFDEFWAWIVAFVAILVVMLGLRLVRPTRKTA